MTPDTFVLTPLFAPCLMVIGHARNQHAVSDNTLEFMLADGLVKKPWPLDGKISRQLNAMESGKWLAIVARKDCEHCQIIGEQHCSSLVRINGIFCWTRFRFRHQHTGLSNGGGSRLLQARQYF